MRKFAMPLWTGLTLLLLLSLSPLSPGLHTTRSGAPPAPDPIAVFGNLPLAFEPNAGQTDPTVRFQAHAPGGMLFFTPAEVVLTLSAAASAAAVPLGDESFVDAERPSVAKQAAPAAPAPPRVVRMQWLGANPAPDLVGGNPLPGQINYLLGNDPTKWQTNLATYQALTYQDLYPGIDLTYEGGQGRLKGTYTIAPGADPGQIRWRYEGARAVDVDAAGNLLIQVPGTGCAGAQMLTEEAPLAWQQIEGQRVAVAAHYVPTAEHTVGVALGAYDRHYPLTLDPALVFATYLGGSAEDKGWGIAVDGAGNVYVTGYTDSLNFPVQSALQGAYRGGVSDAFVTKLNASGSALIYSTYLGGMWDDDGRAIAVDASGQVYLTGETVSPDFPVQNPYQGRQAGYDVFVTKLSVSGSALIYSTFFGGALSDTGLGIAVDGAGQAYVTGRTYGTIPTRNAYQDVKPGYRDAFVARLDTTSGGNASLIYSTYLGGGGVSGNDEDDGRAIAVDGAGQAYVTGWTNSLNFPVRNAYQASLLGPRDAFVTRLDTTSAGAASLIYSTYLGGSVREEGWGIGLVANGQAYVTGWTSSSDFPVLNAYQGQHAGDSDAFVTRLDTTSAGTASLISSTFLGGTATEQVRGGGVDGTGRPYVTGWTNSNNFPLQNAYQGRRAGGNDAFVSKLNAGGSALVYSTYLGGSSDDAALAITVDGADKIYITGETWSTDFPASGNPYQPVHQGGPANAYIDAFVAEIDPVVANPTLVPGLVYATSADQQAPRVDGVIAVWEEFQNGTWDVLGKSLETGELFTIAAGVGDQRHPALSGRLVVWQDNRNGTWDIYAAQLEANGQPPGVFPIATPAQDQINPAISGDHVVWQSGTAARYDIVGAIIRFTYPVTGTPIPTPVVGTPVVLSENIYTNLNPDVAAWSVLDPSMTPVSVNAVVWQSALPGSTPGGGRLYAVDNFPTPGPTYAVPPARGGEQTYPRVSSGAIVWQESYPSTRVTRPQGGNTRWGAFGLIRLPQVLTFTVAVDLAGEPRPAISGSSLAWQAQATPGAPWTVQQTYFFSGTVLTAVPVVTGLPTPPLPDVSREKVVWQAPSLGNAPAGGDLDIYGTLSTPLPTPCALSFSDVPPTHPFYPFVRCLACRGIVSGYSDGTFQPQNNVTRGQLSKIIASAAGLINSIPSTQQTFADVPTANTFWVFIERLVATGAISGYTCGGPGEPCDPQNRPYFRWGGHATRGQIWASSISGTKNNDSDFICQTAAY